MAAAGKRTWQQVRDDLVLDALLFLAADRARFGEADRLGLFLDLLAHHRGRQYAVLATQTDHHPSVVRVYQLGGFAAGRRGPAHAVCIQPGTGLEALFFECGMQ